MGSWGSQSLSFLLSLLITICSLDPIQSQVVAMGHDSFGWQLSRSGGVFVESKIAWRGNEASKPVNIIIGTKPPRWACLVWFKALWLTAKGAQAILVAASRVLKARISLLIVNVCTLSPPYRWSMKSKSCIASRSSQGFSQRTINHTIVTDVTMSAWETECLNVFFYIKPQQILLKEVSLVSTPLCPADPEFPTINIRNRSWLLSKIHTRFSSLTQIFRSRSNCKLSCRVLGLADLNERWPDEIFLNKAVD